MAVGIASPARADDDHDALAKAELLVRDGQYQEAGQALDAVIRSHPDDGRAHADRGRATWRALIGRADGAGDGFAAIQARLCLETQRTCPDVDAALSDLGRAIGSLDGPVRGAALAKQARIRLRLGHDRLALADQHAVIALDPQDAEAFESRAITRDHMGDAAGALADLDAVLRLRPHAGADLVMRAELRRRTGDIAGARADLDEALSNVPSGLAPDRLEHARMLRRAVAAPGEAAMAEQSAPLKVATTGITTDTTGRPALSVTFDPESSKALAAYTGAHVGSAVGIRVGDEVVSRPRILSPITGGIVVISGDFEPGALARLKTALGMPGATVTLREVH